MNPNRLIGDVKLDEDLRAGPDYRPPELQTHFAYPDDGGSFAEAIDRCFGMAKCRNLGSLTMCPSFQVTREERHSTRGRARLLFEMLKGDPIADGWRSDEVKESLELCLSCKGCTGGCPVHVDIPTYKAEFLSHYYERRLRPLHHYVLGLAPWWGAAASRAPGFFNALAGSSRLAPVGKRMAGLAVEREAPRFASQTFRSWFKGRGAGASGAAGAGGATDGGAASDGRQRLLLWPDTFTNLFEPAVGQAAVEVLEAAGFAVELPAKQLCCGRPLYDFGMLALAKRTLRRVLDQLSEPIAAGVPMLVLEPSCAAVFRDELRTLMPGDERARRLVAQTFVLDELLERYAPDWSPPAVEAHALVQGHCHQEAIMGVAGGRELLGKARVEVEPLPAGCCGMAGSFGYQAGDPYTVSVQAGERVLLPAVRAAPPETMIVADGFSCRTQIASGAGRQALHTAQVLALGLERTGA